MYEFFAGDYDVAVIGAGMVGSFMCDLNGNWSSDFMSDSSGQNLLLSIINKLFPSGNIRP